MGKCFVVLSVENQFVYLCNGKNRKVDTPKKKKIKHIEYQDRANDKVCQALEKNELTDKAVRRAISEFQGYITAESN
ncbi:MAG: RNA-binding protein [Clostridia bacterium]|nr:RNA-binding protein [Clostridia bacterium]